MNCLNFTQTYLCSRSIWVVCIFKFERYYYLTLFLPMQQYQALTYAFFMFNRADMSCFQGLFFCPEACSLLLHNFCIYHINPPGHEVCNLIAGLHSMLVFHVSTILNYFLQWMLFSTLFLIWYFFQELLQLGAAAISDDEPVLSVDDLADQIAEVLNHFG